MMFFFLQLHLQIQLWIPTVIKEKTYEKEILLVDIETHQVYK